VVLDPFAGIGTVGQAAAKLGRRFVLIEINPQYTQEIGRRAKYREKPLLLRSGLFVSLQL
jgi:site-specific DNA-methyltransferase (adenine-specific)